MYSLLLFALTTAISKSSVLCGVGADWHDGDIVLEDIVTGSVSILETTNKNLNSLTRQGTNGPFYTAGHQDFELDSEFTLFKYDPCNNTGLETIGTAEVIGYDIRGLAYNPNDNLLYAIFFDTKSALINKLYTINPNTVSLTYIADVSDRTETLEFDENGVLYGWSPINGLFTVDITTGDINTITTISEGAAISLQFLAFDPNDNNIIYVGFQSVYKVNKLNGTYTLTSYQAHSHRGFIMLDQDTCNQIQCNTEQPTITPTNDPSQQPTIAPTDSSITPTNDPSQQPTIAPSANTESLTNNSIDSSITTTNNSSQQPSIAPTDSIASSMTDSATLEATVDIIIDMILTDESIEEVKEKESKNGDSVSIPTIIIGIIIVFIICCGTYYCRRCHQRKIKEEKQDSMHSMAKQTEMNHSVIETSSLSPDQCSEEKLKGINQDDGNKVNDNVIGVVKSIPIPPTMASELSYNPMRSTYATDFSPDFNKLNDQFVCNQ